MCGVTASIERWLRTCRARPDHLENRLTRAFRESSRGWVAPRDLPAPREFCPHTRVSVIDVGSPRWSSAHDVVSDDEERTRLEDYQRQAVAATTTIEEVMSLKDRDDENS